LLISCGRSDAPAVLLDVRVELRDARRAEGEGSGRRVREGAGPQQVQHAVPDDLGVGGHADERRGVQLAQDGIGDVADTRLQRQQLRWQPSVGDLVGQEVDQVAGDLP